MKKQILSITAAMLAISGLQGCSSSDDHGLNPDEPVTINVWNYYNGNQKAAFDNLVETFNQTVGKEKGIIVDVTSMGSINNIHEELDKSLHKKVNALPLPDLFSTYTDTAEEVDKKDMLVSLNTYMSEKDMDKYIDSYMEEGRIYPDEDIKIFPVAKASEVLIINKTAWDRFANETGADLSSLQTWEGLKEISKSYYEHTGKAFFGRDAVMNYLYTGSAQLGSELFTIKQKNAEFTVKEDVMRKLWDNYYIPYISGYYTKKGKFASDDFKTEDIIASVSSSAGASFFPKEVTLTNNTTEQIEYMVLSIPDFADTKPYAISQGAGMSIIKSNETKEYAGILFLEWMSEPEQNIGFTAQNSYLPVTKKGTDSTLWKKTVKKQDIKLNSLVKDTITVSLKQIQEDTVYTPKNFTNSYKVRTYLENALIETAQKDRNAVEQAIADGKTLEEAIQPYASDQYFQKWFQNTSNELSVILKGKQ